MNQNFATLIYDPKVRLRYLTDAGSGRRLYLYKPCRVCGITRYGFSRRPTDRCAAHEKPEANENE
jgi:hypothetical protein